MQKWEYMFVRHFDGWIVSIGGPGLDSQEFEYPKDRPNWEFWLKVQGLDGWELVSEYTLNKSNSVHATLKRPIQ